MKKFLMSAVGFLMVLLFSMMPVTVIAETEPSMVMAALEGSEDLLFSEIPSVYSASKYEQKITDAPSSVSIITADEIRKYGYRTLAEALSSLRGFLATYDRNYHYINVRGFGIPGDYNSRILLLIDGHRQNDNLYDSAFIGTDSPIDIDIVDRIEVVRGPSSSIYGTNAFFAVVNVITKQGRSYKGLELSGDYGTFNTGKVRGTYGNRFSSGVELLLSASYYESDGDDKLYFEEFDDPATDDGIAEDLDNDHFFNFYGMASYEDFTVQGTYQDRKKDVPTAPWDTAFNEHLWTQDTTYWLDLKYEHIFENELTLMARASYNYYWYNADYPYDWGPPDGIVDNRDIAEGEWIYGELHMKREFLQRHNVILGGDYQNNVTMRQENYDTGFKDAPYLDSNETSYHWGAFIQDEFTISDSWILNAGLRYDSYETFGGTVNPRAALIYKPFEKTTFKGVYGSAFRAPNAYELYYDDSGETQLAPDDLDPETIQTFELIYEQYVGDTIRGTVVGFYYLIDDLIAVDEDPDHAVCYDEITDTYTAPCLVIGNLGEVSAIGLEFEVEGKWESGYAGRFSYSYHETEDNDTGKLLPNSPKHLAKLNVTIPLLRDKIFLGFEEHFVGELKTLSGDKTDSYFISNVTLFSQNLVKDLELSASVYNLFDEQYSFPAGEEHLQDSIEQDGRTYRLKLTYLF